MEFEDAVELVEQINGHLGWSAEIEAGGEDEDAYILVMARFERYGLVYNVEIENVGQWVVHKQRLYNWLIKKEHQNHGS